MKIQDITSLLEKIAPPSLQESYDNAGLLTGKPEWECSGIIISLDATEAVVNEAVSAGANLIIAHHPIIFGGLKKINGKNYVEQTIIAAIKNDIAIYAIHTNLDNVIAGVNGKIADMLGLVNRRILSPKKNLLRKLVTFVPDQQAEQLRNALFEAGAGSIGNYSECSFNTHGEGSFKAGTDANPHVGNINERHFEKETRVEMIFPVWLEAKVLAAMRESHPYEEVAYDILNLDNEHQLVGSGLVGDLKDPVQELELLSKIKDIFNIKILRHTALLNRPVSRIALCGGAGSFLTGVAIASGADMYLTSDVKYHEFFDANNRLVIADIGHYESEQFTISLLFDILREKFPTFAIQKTGVITNPVHYL